MSFTRFLWANYNVSVGTDTNRGLAGPGLARQGKASGSKDKYINPGVLWGEGGGPQCFSVFDLQGRGLLLNTQCVHVCIYIYVL